MRCIEDEALQAVRADHRKLGDILTLLEVGSERETPEELLAAAARVGERLAGMKNCAGAAHERLRVETLAHLLTAEPEEVPTIAAGCASPQG